jgi:hypothetical protein
MTAPSAAPCEICADCDRVGHRWIEVRTLDSRIPRNFVCSRCPVVLAVTVMGGDE